MGVDFTLMLLCTSFLSNALQIPEIAVETNVVEVIIAINSTVRKTAGLFMIRILDTSLKSMPK